MRRTRALALGAVLAVLALVTTVTTGFVPHRGRPPVTSPGLVGTATLPGARAAVSPDEARGAHFVRGTSILAEPGGAVLLVPPGGTEPVTLPRDDGRVREAIAFDRGWLRAGSVPGRNPEQRAAARRALLDLRLLTSPDGAFTASWAPHWDYVWPRDAGFAAVAFCATGHRDEAARILSFLAQTQDPGGLWAARYTTDGSPVTDGRHSQLDAPGWVLWAAWFWYVTGPRGSAAGITQLRPTIERAADRIAALLGRDGLPPPGSDYWERSPAGEQYPGRTTLGVAAPMLTGLRSAAALADRLGWTRDAGRWHAAARRLAGGITRSFGSTGYGRQPVAGSPADAAVTMLAPPFARRDSRVAAAVHRSAHLLAVPDGGVLPGQRWSGSHDQAWTPETGMFALTAAASGARSNPWLRWLLAHRTSLGSFPERVDGRGRPASVAPLGWTSALVLLTLSARSHPLPTPPA